MIKMNVCTAPIQTTVLQFYSFEITSQSPVLFIVQILEQSYRGDGLGEGMFRMQIKDKCRLLHLELVLPTWLAFRSLPFLKTCSVPGILLAGVSLPPSQGQEWRRGGGGGGGPEDRTEIVGCVWFQVGRNGMAGCGFEIQETALYISRRSGQILSSCFLIYSRKSR